MSYMHVGTSLVLFMFSLSLMGESFLCSGPLTEASSCGAVDEYITHQGSCVNQTGDPVVMVAAESCCVFGALLGWQ